MNARMKSYTRLLSSLFIFGSIGLIVRYIPLPSSMIAFFRAFIGVVFLFLILLVRKTSLSYKAIKQNWLWLLLSGCAIGFNWIFLFEAYRYTSVAISTLCYYMAPIIVTVLAPFFLKERITFKRISCVFVALVGMTFISGVLSTNQISSGTLTGMMFGFAAALLYASVILLNKQLRNINAIDRTVCQLFICAIVLLPYNALTCEITQLQVSTATVLLLFTVGVVHTGLAYYMYFGAMSDLSGQSIAIASYIDPVVAVIVSVVLLNEPFKIHTMIGAAAILGAALFSELPQKERKKS